MDPAHRNGRSRPQPRGGHGHQLHPAHRAEVLPNEHGRGRARHQGASMKEMNEWKWTAPRAMVEDIEDIVSSEHYFTAAEGVVGAAVESGQEQALYSEPLMLLTIC